MENSEGGRKVWLKWEYMLLMQGCWIYLLYLMYLLNSEKIAIMILLPWIQGRRNPQEAAGDADGKKFDGTGYDKDLVDVLEKDIISRNPNVHWYWNIFKLLFGKDLNFGHN